MWWVRQRSLYKPVANELTVNIVILAGCGREPFKDGIVHSCIFPLLP